ncbi:hypothetical protein [uncultured Psychrobacter sp.]|uniref:hypothetical protein n=1 Tax=uncultured Psychrobacter sp. TaxID=259303 RepID=UPI0032B30E0A
MSHSQQDEQQKLEAYLEAKAKEEQENQQKESEPLSAYEACVLRESARVRELMAETRRIK